MCKVYNLIGSLTTVKNHLHKHNITEFTSLNEVITFQKNYTDVFKQIISQHEVLITQEKNTLSADIAILANSIKTEKDNAEKYFQKEIDDLKQQLDNLILSSRKNFIARIISHFKKKTLVKQIRFREFHLDYEIAYAVRSLVESHKEKSNRHMYISSHFNDAVTKSSQGSLRELERKKRIIDEVNSCIYGALGEQKVVKELESLSDEYILINDLSLSFRTPVYNRQENEYIKSIQIDHILVTPSGIFLIETKNWSEKSLNNLNLRSPVQQVKRTNFILFKVLMEGISEHKLNLNQHHWGNRKIPIRNLIVLTKVKPKEEFQYVKILTLHELIGYIKYFESIFSFSETEEIAKYLRDYVALNKWHNT
ncbi:MAG TPA: NERD domain-containing protein [Flavisolibacter sp.]|nr:NERD domain-containing protein [Flavisolibacter sp.]